MRHPKRLDLDLLLGFLLAGWLVLWRRVGDRWGWLGLLNAWAEWGGVALAGLALVAASRARWRQALALVVLAPLGLAHGQGSRWRARLAPPQEPAATLTLFDANLFKKGASVAAHIALIRRHRPDLVCLQELTPPFAAEFVTELSDEYPFRAWRPRPDSYGFGVLSRFPIAETGYWEEEPGAEPWCQRVSCTLPGGQVVEVYNAHLVPPSASSTFERGMTWGFRAREAQVRLVQGEIEARGLPACLIGDCNFADSADAYRIACERLRDGWRTAGSGSRWTWPTRAFPVTALTWNPRLLRLDYCFHNEAFRPTAMQVLTSRTDSDHCPLLIEVAVA